MNIKAITKPGTILWCINWTLHPNKPRPVLVVRRINDINGVDWVLAAYGTGQYTTDKSGRLSEDEFELISQSDIGRTRLQESTKFNFKKVLPFELTENNFEKSLGLIPKSKMEIAIFLFNKNKDGYDKLR